jgi:two-component system cell cycle response regulator
MSRGKILYIEDNKAEAKLTRTMLEKNGYEVVWVEEGSAGIRTAKTSDVELILLDLMLPDINGNEVCRWLKMNDDTRGIPIIMLTVKGSMADKVSGLHAGADDYLPKPYNEIELNARIYACLRNKALLDELRQKNRELAEMLERVETLAITDTLTELYNRRRFQTIIEKEFNRSIRYGSPLSCMMIDIDYFKAINDNYGHRLGDQVLHEVAQTIRKDVRDIDTPARWGGEEFIVLLPETTKEKALEPAGRILNDIASHEFNDLPDRRISVSIGIACTPDPTIDSGEKLIVACDMAMYNAKHNGRNRVEVA